MYKFPLDLFQDPRFADAEIVIRRAATARAFEHEETGGEDGDKAEGGLEELKRFPGHLAALCQSEYFNAQVKFLAGVNSSDGSKPVLTFTIDEASQLPAAESVIAAMYNKTQHLQELQQTLLVQAVQFADVMMVPHVASQAVSFLVDKAKAEGLQPEALAALCGSAWLGSLIGQPEIDSKIELLLLSLAGFGKLEDVWADSKLSQQLLALPLPAMRLLLAADKLQVCSEDTVLYTAARFVVAQPEEQQAEAREQLAALIRAPHLSQFQLTAQVVNTDTSMYNVLQQHKQSLGCLLTIRRIGSVTAAMVKKCIPEAPASWQLGPRSIIGAKAVKLAWRVPVSDIKAAYEQSINDKCDKEQTSKTMTPPLNGLAWELQLVYEWDQASNGVQIGLYSMLAEGYPKGVCCQWEDELEGEGVRGGRGMTTLTRSGGYGDPDHFRLGTMTGEWHKSVWAKRGLPVDGDIKFGLVVHRVC